MAPVAPTGPRPLRTSPRGWLAIAFALFSVAWFALPYPLRPYLSDEVGGLAYWFLYDAWAWAASLAAVALVVRHSRERFWVPLLCGTVTLAIGDTLWDLSEHGVISIDNESPSLMDLFYLPTYATLAVTAWRLVRRYNRGLGTGYALDTAVVAGAVAAALAPVMLGTYMGVLESADTPAQVVQVLYPISDLLLAGIFMVTMLSGTAPRPVRCLGLAALMILLADQGFVNATVTDSYGAGIPWIDWMYLAQYTFMAAAVSYRLPPPAPPPEDVRFGSVSRGRVVVLVIGALLCPLLFILIQIFGADGPNHERIETIYSAATFVMTALVCVRLVNLLATQARTTRELRTALAERERLSSDLEHQARHDAVTGLPNRYHLANHASAILGTADDVRGDAHDDGTNGAAARPGASEHPEHAEHPEHSSSERRTAERRTPDASPVTGHQPEDGELAHLGLDGGTAAHAVVFLDLDDFKAVNDSFGHEAGDLVLRETARRLRQVCRKDDVVARLGGDEFAILLPGSTTDAAAALARAMVDVVNEPILVAGRRVRLGASAGIARLGHEHGRYADALAEADIAMYAAKRAGKNRVMVFAEDMRRDLLADADLAADLTRAVRERRITVAYQPVVAMRTGLAVGVEALARWHRPDLADISPSVFLPIATKRGLVSDLDLHVLDLTLANLVQWRQQAPQFLGGFNASAATLGRPDFVEQVHHALARHNLPGSALVVEVTEQAMVEDMTRVAERLAELRRSGITIGLDDFGTGYSSLAVLQDLPVDILKLDRTFLSRGADGDSVSPLLRTVVQLGHDLGMTVVAEGIETAQHYRAALDLGCDYGQGWLLARPMTSADVPRHLTEPVVSWPLAASPNVSPPPPHAVRAPS